MEKNSSAEFLHRSIRKAVEEFFSAHVVEEFLGILSRWEGDLVAHFFQISHGEGKPLLEFGGLVGNAVVDVTVGSSRKRICVLPISAIQGTEMVDKKTSTEFFIRTAGTEDIRYHAVLDKERVVLREYAAKVESTLVWAPGR